MPSQQRLKRIQDRLREELSEMIVREIADPRLDGISVTDVKVDRELAYADIFVSAVEGKDRAREVVSVLEHASGFLRKSLAERVDLRVFPRLRFHWDPTPERADNFERLLASLHKDDAPSADTPAQPEGEDEEDDE